MSESSQFIVSARKYRPATFRSVVGQKALTATLKNAVDSKRLAQAYLFTGPRGVGKTSCARIFAKTINCLSPTPDGEACCQCDSCRAFEQGNSFNIIELDAASNNSVNDIRSLIEQVYVPPQVGAYRVFIIDEVHMLSNQAFNAFLKTLEEPPKYVVFILATTEKHKVIPTILSRCQVYDFKRITIEDMVEHLEYVASQEGITAERQALGVIARKADGAMRDALSIFDQVSASCRGNITYQATIESLNVLDYEFYFRLVDAFRLSDVAEALLIYKEIRDKGFDSLFFLSGLAAHVRDLMVAADQRTLPLLETAREVAERYAEQARSLPLQWYYAAMKILGDADVSYRTASSKRLLVELTLIRLCQLLKPLEPPFDAVDRTPPLHNPVPPIEPAPKIGPTSPQPSAPQTSAPQQPAAAAPQPVPQPAVAAIAPPAAPQRSAPAPQPRPAQPGRPQTMRLSDITRQAESASSRRERTESVTPEGFLAAWNNFIAANPERHILLSAMRTAVPTQISPTEFHIAVGHPAQAKSFEMDMPVLISYLRDSLSNDLLTLSVSLADNSNYKRPLPPQDFLRKIVEENPLISKVLRDFDAEVR